MPRPLWRRLFRGSEGWGKRPFSPTNQRHMKPSTFWHTLSRPQAQQAVALFIMVSLITHSLVGGEAISFMVLVSMGLSLASLVLTATLRVSRHAHSQTQWTWGINLFRSSFYPVCFGLFVFIAGYFFFIVSPAFSLLKYIGLPIILSPLIFQSFFTYKVTLKK